MRTRILSAVLIILAPFLVGIVVGYAVGHPHYEAETLPPGEEPATTIQQASSVGQPRDSLTDQISSQRRNAITRAVSMVSPAVAGVSVTEVREYRDPWSQFFGDDPFFRQFFGDRTYRQEVKGLGSGFIISPDGYILTNDHVAGNASRIVVTLTSGEKYSAELVGTDMVSDISLLKIDG